MARLIVLSIFLALAAAQTTERNCPAEYPIGLCCISLEPFSANSYVWESVCGFTPPADLSTPTASFCGAPGTCYSGIIPVCCEKALTCQSGVDGPTGINCTRVEP
ncbi:hypothetical protein K488DRAFT_45047 [Vararia minispora EC-137]|uniref:Uncharacterized protein n=1 Tax=Vararia minispora EC-137 TaxID=1314806 RepID=A0ACB8QS39_9AGAM|nr:hypothetical protein K488DRAFT_45047 [Vararia minispora EC-137]